MEKTDGRVLRAQARRERTRANILDTARTLFRTCGYDAVSIDDIIAEADIARATFYLHFDSKVAMVSALLSSFVADLTQAIVLVDATKDYRPQLCSNFERVLDVAAAHADVARMLMAAAEPELVVMRDQFSDYAISMIGRSLAAGKRRRVLRAVDSETAAAAVLGGIREVMARRLFSGPTTPAARRVLAKDLLEIFLGGLVRD